MITNAKFAKVTKREILHKLFHGAFTLDMLVEKTKTAGKGNVSMETGSPLKNI